MWRTKGHFRTERRIVARLHLPREVCDKGRLFGGVGDRYAACERYRGNGLLRGLALRDQHARADHTRSPDAAPTVHPVPATCAQPATDIGNKV